MKKILALLLLVSLVACTKPIPRILIIGDSISIGYTPFVKEILGDKAIVSHNEGNAQHTGTGLNKVVDWIGEEEWDIIQFNWGLWDLCYRHEDSKVQGQRDKVNGEVTYSPEEYQANLDSLVGIIKSITNAKLLFVSTSYVPAGEAGRFEKDGLIYNQHALEVMRNYNIPTNDIYDFSKEVHGLHATAPDNVHYTKPGYKKLAEKIVEGLSQFDKGLRASNTTH